MDKKKNRNVFTGKKYVTIESVKTAIRHLDFDGTRDDVVEYVFKNEWCFIYV